MFRLLFLVPLCLGLTGCFQTRQTEADRVARERALRERQQQQQLSEYRRRVQLQIEDTEAQVGEVRDDLRALRGELAERPTNRDLQALEERVAGLERQLQQMERQRQRDREEMIEILSKRMAEVMARQRQRTSAASGRTHTVSQGETLSAIAAAYGVSGRALIRANNLNNPDDLKIGQKLVIPAN